LGIHRSNQVKPHQSVEASQKDFYWRDPKTQTPQTGTDRKFSTFPELSFYYKFSLKTGTAAGRHHAGSRLDIPRNRCIHAARLFKSLYTVASVRERLLRVGLWLARGALFCGCLFWSMFDLLLFLLLLLSLLNGRPLLLLLYFLVLLFRGAGVGDVAVGADDMGTSRAPIPS
jgi:hypothetical protein